MDEYKRRRRRSRAVMSMFLDSLNGIIDDVDVAEFDSDGSDLKALIVGIEPVQSGTGDPSPDNVRPITGHSSVNVIVSPTLDPLDGTITNIPLGTTVYGGTLDVLTGVLTVTHILADITSFNIVSSATNRWRVDIPLIKTTESNAEVPNSIAEQYKAVSSNAFNNVIGTFYQAIGAPSINVCDTVSPTGYICYELATPQTIQLTGQQIATFLGTNNVWCDSGKIIHLEY